MVYPSGYRIIINATVTTIRSRYSIRFRRFVTRRDERRDRPTYDLPANWPIMIIMTWYILRYHALVFFLRTLRKSVLPSAFFPSITADSSALSKHRFFPPSEGLFRDSYQKKKNEKRKIEKRRVGKFLTSFSSDACCPLEDCVTLHDARRSYASHYKYNWPDAVCRSRSSPWLWDVVRTLWCSSCRA